MARSVRFSYTRFLHHYKFPIFLTVLLITILLLLSFPLNDTRSHYKSKLKSLHEQQLPYSKAELDAYYKFVLGLHPSNVTATNNVECENVWRIAALPGTDIEDYVWEYMSLIAIRERYGVVEGRHINAFLSERSIEEMKGVFERVHFTDLGTVPERCYRLHEAILVESGNEIFFNPDVQVKSVFLLGEGERRYKEIAQIDGRIYTEHFRLNDMYKRVALSEINNFKKHLESAGPIAINAPVVGIYIRTLELPSTYYERAMDFLRKIHIGSVFLVICPTYLMTDCQDQFSREDTAVQEEHMLELELAILAMCDHAIIENAFGILGALINENMGDVIVFNGMSDELEWFSNYMTENLENWYSIA